MMNSNPETVSTDYDTSSRLYFEPLTVEDVLNVVDKERPDGIIVQFGGQTPLSLAGKLQEALKLAPIPAASGESGVIRTYLDWLLKTPWWQMTEDNEDLNAVRAVLDGDHYGLEKVKDRIMEFIAVGKLKGIVNGKILCLVGPPGVGKTSIGKSIARALDRQYYRFAVGG